MSALTILLSVGAVALSAFSFVVNRRTERRWAELRKILDRVDVTR